jgi:DNA-binding transcriptional MerR regulator
VLNVTDPSIEDLAKVLRERGYSIKAVEEILKWYKESNS